MKEIPRGSLTKSDAQLVYDFANSVADLYEVVAKHKGLRENAMTVSRIAYCALFEARQEERRRRVVTLHNEDPYPYILSE
jgi:hypothetical protein